MERKPPKRKSKDDERSQDGDEDDDEQPERLSSEDAWLFPVVSQIRSSDANLTLALQIGSVLLFGLYVIVKYFGKEWINWILQWYFTIAGVGSGSKV